MLPRTYVASSGLDTNDGRLATPCRSIGAALAQTDPGGEIIVLDSAGYGAVTINKAVSVIAPPGIYAGITVTAGIGIDVTAGVVALRGLTIRGPGGDVGIHVGNATGADRSLRDLGARPVRHPCRRGAGPRCTSATHRSRNARKGFASTARSAFRSSACARRPTATSGSTCSTARRAARASS